jgi:hypothetical protein
VTQTSFTRYRSVIPRFIPSLGKPEALTAAAIVTKEHWKSFIPFDKTTPLPDGTPCRKEGFLPLHLSLTLLDSGGVEKFQQDYAFTAWASSASHFKSSYSSSNSHSITP